ncbi:hypothetical protein EOM60_01960 [Candidatus Saccharibacteria bacterium]|nr:hypothetical protein [Candidatus Saccharibacteria bacterium]
MSTRREAIPRDPGTKSADIGDLVDFHGDRAVQPNGQFITNHQMNQIANFQDQIRNGLPVRDEDEPPANNNEPIEEETNRLRQLEQAQRVLKDARSAYALATAESRIGFIRRREVVKAKRAYDNASANMNNLRVTDRLAQVDSIWEQGINEIAVNRQTIEAQGGSVEQSLAELKQRLRTEIKTNLMNMIGEEDALLEGEIVQGLCAKSAEATRLSNLWARQKGWGGRAKKALAVFLAGGAVGVVAATGFVAAGVSALVATVGLGVAGGVTGLFGGLFGRRLNKRLPNSYTEDPKKNTSAKKVAQVQSEQNLVAKEDIRNAQVDEFIGHLDAGGVDRPKAIAKMVRQSIIDPTERFTTDSIRNNRRRSIWIGLGAVAGYAVGVSATYAVHNCILNSPVAPEASPPGGIAPQIQGNEFFVDSGHGYVHELTEFANLNGINLDPDQAWGLHSGLVNEFGPDYINIHGAGGNDIYREFLGDGVVDYRLTMPGAATWENGVAEYSLNWMLQRGL